MASINGISLKGVNHHRGHEGEDLLQGNVFFLDKKIGFYSDGDWGGPHTLDVSTDVMKMFNDYYSFDYPDQTGLHILIWDLQALIENEKIYKKFLKSEHTIMVAYKEDIRHWEVKYVGWKSEVGKYSDQALINHLKKEHSNVAVLGIYRSLDDFNQKNLACLTPTYAKFVDKVVEL
jgi:hypothetical protein